jgi:threonine dehydrogenase-like Zn-dependent dehydrogenase
MKAVTWQGRRDVQVTSVPDPVIDVLGHEPMGVVEEVGADVEHIAKGDRVVIPFNISCGVCWMCDRGLQSQCETTQVRDQGTGAALFGYTKLYGQVPGGQAEYLRVPQAHYGPIKGAVRAARRSLRLPLRRAADAWQAVEYAEVPEAGSVAVFGLGSIGEMCTRVAQHRGAAQAIAVDLVPERLARASAHGVETVDITQADDIADRLRGMTRDAGPTA